MLLVNTKRIVLLKNDYYLIKCCWWMKKTKLIRDRCDKKPSHQLP